MLDARAVLQSFRTRLPPNQAEFVKSDMANLAARLGRAQGPGHYRGIGSVAIVWDTYVLEEARPGQGVTLWRRCFRVNHDKALVPCPGEWSEGAIWAFGDVRVQAEVGVA